MFRPALRIALTLGLLLLTVASGPFVTNAVAAPVCPTDQDSFATAISAAGAGGTVTFSCDATITLSSTITLTNVTIDGNGHQVTISGNKAVVIFVASENVTLDSLTVVDGFDNGAGPAVGGGAVRVTAGSTLSILDSTFTGNSATWGLGGAILNQGTVTITNSSFTGNTASAGGVIANYGDTVEVPPTVTITNSTFNNNLANSGGVVYTSNGVATFISSTFDNNSGSGYAGVVRSVGSSLTIINSTLSNNYSDFSGAIGAQVNSTLSIANSTFTGNWSGRGPANITSTENTTVRLVNTILSGNASQNSMCLMGSGATATGPFTNDGGSFSTDFSCPGVPRVSADDLKLDVLADNGGPTKTIALLPGSAAIGAGIVAACNSAPVSGVDQRGQSRGATSCDSGAFETDYPPPPDTTAPIISSTLDPAAPDGANGWYRSDVTLTWTVTDPESAPSIVLTGCENQSIIADQSATTYSCAATSSGGAAGPLSVTIKRDATPPNVTVTGVSDGATYDSDEVPAADCSIVDVTSGVATTATLSTEDGPGDIVTITCDGATDNAGNVAAPVSVTYTVTHTVIDTTAPVITPIVIGTLGNNNWYTSDVTVTWTVVDDESDLTSVTGCDPTTIDVDTAGQVLICSATSAGGTAQETITIKRDATKPVITDDGATADPEGNDGWYISPVTNGFAVTDNLSGIVGQTNPYTFAKSSGATEEGPAVTITSGTITDAAGNIAEAISSTSFKIDLTNPTNVSFAGEIDASGSYSFGAVPAAPTCTATDAVSGLAGCVVSGYSTAIGTHTLTATATDNAGRTATATLTYSIADTTAPMIAATLDPAAPDGDNGWYRSDVTLTWTVTDAESASLIDLTGCANQRITSDQAATDYACIAESDGGTAGPQSVTIKRDATPPAVTISGVTDGASYVAGSVPAAGCATTDVTSGVAVDATLSLSGGPRGPITATCAGAVDNAGNTASVSVTYTVTDGSAPLITYTLDPATPNGANGWYTSDVTLTWTVVEPETPDTLTQVGCANQTITADRAEKVYSCSATSAGGAAARVDVTIRRDATAPDVAVTGIADGAVYTLGDVPAAGCTTTDATSGVATAATISTSGGPVGEITATCSSAVDNAGNVSSASATYTVLYDWQGFVSTTDDRRGPRKTLAGMPITVIFMIDGNVGLDAVESITTVACNAAPGTEPVPASPLGRRGSLQQGSGNTFIFQWQTTRSMAGTCQELRVTLADGTTWSQTYQFQR